MHRAVSDGVDLDCPLSDTIVTDHTKFIGVSNHQRLGMLVFIAAVVRREISRSP
jgi:hypothetical protein